MPKPISTTTGPVRAERSLLTRRIIWVTVLILWAFATASLVSFNTGDAPTQTVFPAHDDPHNWCGRLGAVIAHHSYRALGWGAWIVVLGTAFFLAIAAQGRALGHVFVRAFGLLMLGAAGAALQALALPKSGPIPSLAGGLIGTVGAAELVARFNPFGTLLWILLLGAIGMLVAFDRWLLAGPIELWKQLGPAAKMAGGLATAAGGAVRAGGGFLSGIGSRGREAPAVRLDDLEEESLPEEMKEEEPSAAKVVWEDEDDDDDDVITVAEPQARRTPPRVEEEDEPEVAEAVVEAGPEDDLFTPEPPAPPIDEQKLREKIARLPIRFAATDRRLATEEDLRDLQGVTELEGYRFPGLDLLEDPEQGFGEKLEGLVREQAQALEAALRQYRIEGEVVGIESGPVITLYDVRLAPGTKVSALSAVSSDIARALKAVNIRIVANQAGRDTVGVEVPNPTKEKVRLKELMGKSEVFGKMRLPMFLGKDASGELLIADLAQMPHMLIAGTTGSGKSVCMNAIIMSFLYTKKPNELKLVLVDPKMVEMSQFKDIPHLMCPVVTDMPKAAAILEWACGKMDERYELLAEAGCRDLAGYNELGWDELKARFNPQTPEEEARIPRKLPYMVFIIDELADLMMTTKEVEGSIIRIAQKARAVGIHLILATQRPQANVVTGLIKSNMPCRVSFKVASGMDSRIVLDQKGGELLLGQGDMLYLSPRTSKLVRAQGTLVDDAEIRKVVRFMREVAAPTFERQLVQLRGADSDDAERLMESENNSSASLAAAQEDPLFDRAVEIVLETKRGSVSLLQRRLAIGYTRASRLIDLMGIAGIISDHKGSVARDVMITPEEWAAMKQLAAQDSGAAPQPGLFEGAPSGAGAGVTEARVPAYTDPAPEPEEWANAPDADDAEEPPASMA